MTKPTIGRQVWYHAQNTGDISTVALSEQPFAATVVHVNEETETVNLLVLDHVGKPHFVSECPLSQTAEHDDVDQAAAYCSWMPYQLSQMPLPEREINPKIDTSMLGTVVGIAESLKAELEPETWPEIDSAPKDESSKPAPKGKK